METDTADTPRVWPDNDEGLRAARDYALWHLGYPDWADSIIYAYLNPKKAQARLAEEKAS